MGGRCWSEGRCAAAGLPVAGEAGGRAGKGCRGDREERRRGLHQDRAAAAAAAAAEAAARERALRSGAAARSAAARGAADGRAGRGAGQLRHGWHCVSGVQKRVPGERRG